MNTSEATYTSEAEKVDTLLWQSLDGEIDSWEGVNPLLRAIIIQGIGSILEQGEDCPTYRMVKNYEQLQ